MEIQVVEREGMTLAGMIYYGALSGEGWSAANPIGQVWQRFNEFLDRSPEYVEQYAIRPQIGYEVNIWNEEESQKTGRFYTFVGVEVDSLDEMPLEVVGKVLPAGAFAHAIPKGQQITTWEKDLYDRWMPESRYKLAPIGEYHYQIQVYEDGRFKGVGDLLGESEIDVFVPVARV